MKFKRLHPQAILPSRGSELSAGLDLSACISEDIEIKPREMKLIPTGWACKVPEGFVGIVHSRSGITIRLGLTVRAGVIDADYRGELMVVLINESDKAAIIQNGWRIAQLVVHKIDMSTSQEVTDLDDTDRGVQGFGSTGTS